MLLWYFCILIIIVTTFKGRNLSSLVKQRLQPDVPNRAESRDFLGNSGSARLFTSKNDVEMAQRSVLGCGED